MTENSDHETGAIEVISRPLGPWIHAGMELVVRQRAKIRQETDAYSLWWVEHGLVEIEEGGRKRRIMAPCGVLLGPGDGRTLHLGVGAYWCMVRFDLLWRLLQVVQRPRVTTYKPVPGSPPQPPLSELLQLEVPAPLPAAACHGLREVLIRCSTTCLLGRDAWYRANYLLGPWLIGLRDALGAEAPVQSQRSRLEDLTRKYLLQGLTVEQTAQLMGIGARQLNRRLREEDPAGPPAKEIIRSVRLGRLCEELEKTSRPLNVLAQVCGYRSATVLIADFKRAMGCTPGAWRARNRP